LHKQYKFLCRSLTEVIRGDLDEIDRISASLRILFHDTKNSKSLLSQVNPNILIIDTGADLPKPPEPFAKKNQYECYNMFMGGMVSVNLGSKAWQLNLSSSPILQNLEDWWNKI